MVVEPLLERDGFSRVVGMGDGERALAAMIEHPPDVMILDVHMPRIDGFRVLREMHNTEARINTVTGILGVSGDQSAATCRAMLCAGADDFIFRPFDGTEFALRVRKLVEVTRHMRRTISYVNFLQSQLRDETRRPVIAE